jgi:hypothetical protein
MFFHSLVRFSFPTLSVMVCWISIASSADAADEILVHVFSADAPLADAKVSIDQVWVGTTAADGSLFADLPGEGTHTLGIDTSEGRVTTRFTSGAGQLVDAIVQMDRSDVFVDVYSQTEGVTERKAAAEGTLNISVRRGDAPARYEPVYIAGLGMSLQTNSAGEATVTLPRGRSRPT